MSYGDDMTEIDLQKNSTTLVVGENGAGKSVLTEVLTFVLYGKPFRKINKPQLVNINNGSNLLVEIEFNSNNKEYKIIRGIKPNIFEIWENGDMINQDAKSLDYQAYLENDVLSMNFITFTQLIVLGKATHIPFMSLPPQKRREMIEHLLGISLFKDINSIIKERVRNTKTDIDKNDYKLEMLNEKLSMKQEYQSNTKKDRTKLIDGIKNSIVIKKKEIDGLETKNHSISVYINTIKVDLKDDISVEHRKFKNRKRDIDNKLKSTNKDIKFFENNTICPTCTQNIDSDFRNNYINDRNNDIIKLDSGSKLVDDKIKEFEDIEYTNSLINNKVHELDIEIKQNSVLIRRLNNEIAVKDQQLNDELSYEGRDITDEIKSVKSSIINESIQNDKFNKMLDYYDVMSDILDDDGVKSLIIKKYLPLFNKYINNYLNKLGLPVTFMLDDRFNETILARHRDNFSYNSFSEGQKLRIDLSIMLAWRDLCKIKNSMDSNLLIMDEIFDSSLTQSGVDSFIEILQDMKDINTFVISHTPEKLADRFDSTIEVSLINGFSQIKENIN